MPDTDAHGNPVTPGTGTTITTTWGGAVADHVIPSYPTATARDTVETAPDEGRLCFLEDSNVLQYYDGSAWVTLSLDNGGNVVGALTFENANGEPSGEIQPFDGASRRLIRIHAEADGSGPYLQMIGDGDTSPESIQFRDSSGVPRLDIDPATGIILGRESSMSAAVEMFPRGTLLKRDASQSTTAPGTTWTDLASVTVTLDYSAQPLILWAWGRMRCDNVNENEWIEARVVIDGSNGVVNRMELGTLSSSSHSHGLHDHGGGSSTVPSDTVSVSVADHTLQVNGFHSREWTPSGSSIVAKVQGQRSGPTAGFTTDVMILAMRA